jgi:AmmeMemoRadiSam system protein B/AmmeMemoRadiSam system protein A
MRPSFLKTAALLSFVFMLSNCKAQPVKETQLHSNSVANSDRQPAVAGAFYPADKNSLNQMLEIFFNQAQSVLTSQPLAIIVPHAGYIYSGSIAAAAYKQIDRNREFKHIFIIGSSHTMYFEGASVYTGGNYITPLGKVPIDSLALQLTKKNKILSDDPKPHEKEHGIEVQLPFLQYWLKKGFSIVPIIIGGESLETSRKLAQVLSPYFNEENLFIISTDFSHYPKDSDAKISDQAMTKAVLSNSPEKFMQAKNDNENNHIPNLVTAICGWTSVLTLLDITEKLNDIEFKEILSRNSGAIENGDKERVVGYVAIGVVKNINQEKETSFNLSDEEKISLLKIAKNTVSEYISKKTIPQINEKTLSVNLMVKAGAFVTLKKNGELRGCIGNFKSDEPLYKTIQAMSVASSTEDYRFSPVVVSEIPKIEIEISVLTPMKKINSIDEIVMGKHGIYIRKGMQSGTFLPQVATETGWDKEEFLGHCAQDKAGIGWNGWKDADIYVYEALVFGENDFKDQIK